MDSLEDTYNKIYLFIFLPCLCSFDVKKKKKKSQLTSVMLSKVIFGGVEFFSRELLAVLMLYI